MTRMYSARNCLRSLVNTSVPKIRVVYHVYIVPGFLTHYCQMGTQLSLLSNNAIPM